MPGTTIPFEIHLTVDVLSTAQKERFLTICKEYEAKPLFIELSKGDSPNQPMFSKVVYRQNLADVIELSNTYSQNLKQSGMISKRLKIEIPFDEAGHFTAQNNSSFETYYEWHAKICYVRVKELMELCALHQVHVSRNSLKNEQELRFITLREFGSPEVFMERIRRLTDDLAKENRELQKQHFEYCVFDDNTYLDAGWLPQNRTL